jgi:hypothetical protein
MRSTRAGRRRWLARLLAVAFAPRLAAGAAPRPVPRAAGPTAAAALRVAATTERVLKLHGQVGARVLVPRARRALGPALADLAAAVRVLGTAPAPSELHERLAILAILVNQFRPIARKPAGRDLALALAERAEEIEWEAERVAALVEAAGGAPRDPAAKAEEAAGDAERIGRLLLWERWGIAGPTGAKLLAAAKAALQSGLEALREAPQPGAIEAELQVADNQAAFLFASAYRLDWGEAGGRELEYAVKASDNARESLERLAALYARAGG